MPPKPPADVASDKFTDLYVTNIHPWLTKVELNKVFRPYGEIVWSAIGDNHSFSLVGYTSHDDAIAAIKALHNKPGTWSDSLKNPHVARAWFNINIQKYQVNHVIISLAHISYPI